MNRKGRVFGSQVLGLRSQELAVGSQEPGDGVIGRPFLALFFLAMVIAAGAGFLAPAVHVAKAGTSQPGTLKAVSSLSMPLFFEPNEGQTAPQVKFLARGSGYALFLTADEAVLELQPSTPSPFGSGQAKNSHQQSGFNAPRAARSGIRMRLDGANSSPRVSGASPLAGKSNYFIGNDPSKWRHGIPQFAQVQYQAVYPGIDLVYYGNQGQLEYDFRVAPGADPNRIVLCFDGGLDGGFAGASAHIDSGDLILSTNQGDVRFHAPHIYQQDGGSQKAIAGSFRQIAKNKIGFTVGDYDRNRELVIDPVLTYSTYLGGSNDESLVHMAFGGDGNVYLAGSTLSSDFPTVTPFQGQTGTQNIFIAVLNPSQASTAQLLYATYLGGSGVDSAAGVAVSSNVDSGNSGYDVYVAGSTTSPNFPTNGANAPFQAGPASGTHGFITRLNWESNSLRYSTYLSGNGSDAVTGLAVDGAGDAFVTGITTSTNDASNGFPANSNGYQTLSNDAGHNQFFASKINTKGTGTLSMLYSTYFGGGNPSSGVTQGGGIAVDRSGNMFITGGTNFGGIGPNKEPAFPILNAQQSCLDEASKTACSLTNPAALDAFLAKINPNIAGVGSLLYSTYLGGAGDDIGNGIAVDSAGNAYVTGSTTSAGATGWVPPTAILPFQSDNGGGVDAFIAKIGNPGSATLFPLTYFTYLGGTGNDVGQAIVVDANQAAHVAGTTNSTDLPVLNPLPVQVCAQGGANDAMVALISTTFSGRPSTTTANTGGDYLTCLGGTGDDQGTGIALDMNNLIYVSGITLSSNFPTVNPYQAQLNGSHYDAFVSKLGASSSLTLTVPTTSPSPNPVAAGNQVAFTFDITNNGPDTATNVIFTATIPSTGVASQAAKVISGTGSCGGLVGTNTITCTISSLAVGAIGAVEVDLTPTIPVVNQQLTGVSGAVSANGGAVVATASQNAVGITDFQINATTPAAITSGQITNSQITLAPLTPLGYTASISVSVSALPTGATATFSPVSPIAMSGTTPASTTLSIATTARPVTTGSLLPRHWLYATWLPVGGLSLLGLGLGAGHKRRRWLAGAFLALIAGILVFQGACGSSSTATATGGTPAGTYPITITGSSGTISHNTTVQLIVN